MREDSGMTQWRETFSIARDHPALPGHFPGQPVVPGVLLLDRVAAALERYCGAHVAGLPQVKFLRPLLPAESAELTLVADGRSIRFHIARDGVAIASGGAVLAALDARA